MIYRSPQLDETKQMADRETAGGQLESTPESLMPELGACLHSPMCWSSFLEVVTLGSSQPCILLPDFSTCEYFKRLMELRQIGAEMLKSLCTQGVFRKCMENEYYFYKSLNFKNQCPFSVNSVCFPSPPPCV